MKVAKQLSVMLPNRPGQLALLCRKLAAAKVNILALSVIDNTEEGFVRLVVDRVAAARKILQSGRLGFVETEVILAELMNHPGTMADIAARLAKAGVNIKYVYGTAACGSKDGIAVFGFDDIRKAKKAV